MSPVERRALKALAEARVQIVDLREAGQAMYEALSVIGFNGGHDDCMDRWEALTGLAVRWEA